MQMMKPVVPVDGFLNVFPNNKHQDRADGHGCAALSPMQLGPVQHRQPGLPEALNIENYHQFNKVWPSEVDPEGSPTEEWTKRRLEGYNDPVPHRHKFDDKQLAQERKKVKGAANKNAPLYSVHLTLQGEPRRFTYVQSRYFYCRAYASLARQSPQFAELQRMLAQGTNLMLCGYDAYTLTLPLYVHYHDANKPFGHELVLYALLVTQEGEELPWDRYRRENEAVYADIAHVL
jgi:hypothetical protein